MRTIKVIFHVGMPKTATTSIQQTLTENYKSLKDQKVLYPKIYNQQNVMEKETINHNVFLIYMMDPDRFYQKDLRGDSTEDCLMLIKNTVEHIREEIEAGDIETIIFSSEALYARETEYWVELLDGLKSFLPYHLDFSCICYTRSMLSWLDSAAQQMIKTSSVVNRELIDKLSGNGSLYRERIKKFEGFFGKENVHLFDFNESISGQDGIIKGFFKCLSNITEKQFSDIKESEVISNESLCVESVSIINFVNRISPLRVDRKLNAAGGRALGDWEPFTGLKGTKFRISDDLKAYAAERLSDDIKWLKDNYQIDYTVGEEKSGNYLSPDDIQLSKEYLTQLIGIIDDLTYPMCAMVLGYMCSRMKKPTDGEASKEETLLIDKLMKRLSEPESKKHGPLDEENMLLLIKQYEEAHNQSVIHIRDQYEAKMNRFSLLFRIKNRHPKMTEFIKKILRYKQS